jgi:hypothetical protein
MDRRSVHAGSRADRAIALIAGFNTLTAFGGAAGLAWGFLELDEVSTSRLPWGSTAIGGIALALSVAVPNAVLTILASRHDGRAGPIAVAVGALLVLWILLELAFLRELSVFHPLYAVIGFSLIRLGFRSIETRRDLSGPRPPVSLERFGPTRQPEMRRP